MQPIEGVIIKSFRGDSIAQLSGRIDRREVDLSPFDYIIVHVGTNNIDRRESLDNMKSDYGNLIGIIKRKKSSIRIIMSAIIPRPIDHTVTDSMIKAVNNSLRREIGPDLGFHFVETWKAVSKFGSYRRYMYAKLDKGLHLNTEGSRRLRHFFLRVISTID